MGRVVGIDNPDPRVKEVVDHDVVQAIGPRLEVAGKYGMGLQKGVERSRHRRTVDGTAQTHGGTNESLLCENISSLGASFLMTVVGNITSILAFR